MLFSTYGPASDPFLFATGVPGLSPFRGQVQRTRGHGGEVGAGASLQAQARAIAGVVATGGLKCVFSPRLCSAACHRANCTAGLKSVQSPTAGNAGPSQATGLLRRHLYCDLSGFHTPIHEHSGNNYLSSRISFSKLHVVTKPKGSGIALVCVPLRGSRVIAHCPQGSPLGPHSSCAQWHTGSSGVPWAPMGCQVLTAGPLFLFRPFCVRHMIGAPQIFITF